MIRAFLAALLALFIVAPSQAQIVVFVPVIERLPEPKVGSYEGIPNIAILSGFCPNLLLRNINKWSLTLSLSGATDKRIDVSDWDIDRAQVLNSSLLDKDGKFAPSFPGVPMTEDVDAYLILTAIPMRLQANNFEVSGFGIWRPISIRSMTGVFAHYAVTLVDARTLKILRVAPAASSPKYLSPTPFLRVDDALWAESRPTPTPEQVGKMHDVTSEIFGDSIDKTLLRMRIAGKEITGVWPIATPQEPPTAAAAP